MVVGSNPAGRTTPQCGVKRAKCVKEQNSLASVCNECAMLTLEHLAELIEKNRDAAKARVKEFSIGGEPFAFNTAPAIMGVINLSPDSWYRESVCLNTE